MLNRQPTISFAVTAILLLTAALVAGCSDDNNGPTQPGPGDTTPPTVVSVTARDQTSFEVLFSEAVDRQTAENTDNYEILRQGVAPKLALAPGDTLGVRRAALLLDGERVLLSIYPDMVGGETYDVRIQRVKDTSGNEMSGVSTTSVMGSGDPDTTVPTITSRDPAANAIGVGVGQSVSVSFSEPMEDGTVESAFRLHGPGGDVPVSAERMDAGFYTFRPGELLALNTTYTAEFAAGTARDLSGNYLPGGSWDFTTTDVTDTTPPTLVATTPADGATNVSVDVVLRLEFSEPIDPLGGDDNGIFINPDIGDGVLTWTDGGRTLNFDPANPLTENTTYYLNIFQGAVRDLAGNPLSGNYSVTFTTRSSLPTGEISGTISGDPRSAAASSPEGALAVMWLADFLTWDWDTGPAPMAGFVEVAANGAYSLDNLKDGNYWPTALLDADGDGEVSLDYGDAIGVYGVDFQNLTGPPVAGTVTILAGAGVTGVDFTLYDMISIRGEVSYGGTAYAGDLSPYSFYVGVFDTTGFNPGNPMPVIGSEAQPIVWQPEYSFNEFTDGLEAGTYYAGAYMDVDPGDGAGYQPSVDPIGFYRISDELAPVTVADGSDAVGIQIVMQDPLGGPPRGRVSTSWTVGQTGYGAMSPMTAKLRSMAEQVNRIAR